MFNMSDTHYVMFGISVVIHLYRLLRIQQSILVSSGTFLNRECFGLTPKCFYFHFFTELVAVGGAQRGSRSLVTQPEEM